MDAIGELSLGALSTGDELAVRVLHQGEPVAAEIVATFAGFSDAPGAWPYATETLPGSRGEARIKLWSPGYWYVRVEHIASDAAAHVDEHVLRAILSFEVE